MATPQLITASAPGIQSRVSVDASRRAGTTVEVISDYAAFLDMKAAWNETVERAGIAHPFLSHEWVHTWWDCFHAQRQLHIIIVRSGGRIIAIAPLMREMAWMYGVPVRRLRLLHNDHTPRTDFIISERPDEAYRAIWQSLLDLSPRWDLLQLCQLPRDSATLTVLPDLARTQGYSTSVWHSGHSPYVSLSQGWDAYFGAIGAKLKQNLRNRVSRLTLLGDVSLETLQDVESIKQACGDAFRLEASGWKEGTRTSIGCDPAVLRFYTLLAERAANAGWLRLLFLTVGGNRIATAYSACYENRLMFLKTGYDPGYAKCSPFKVLTQLALRDACAAGFSEVDFLGDAEPWKLEWTRSSRPHDWLFIFATSCRGRVLHAMKSQLVPALKRQPSA